MKVYLVGGAVRDELLGYPTKEQDWVVVGATPNDLLARGYQKVGKDFPVFLHPETNEEYALARKERKQAPGYYGFECDFNPNISLEEDLQRRDLTINAMAKDSNGLIIDPFNGQQDLKDRILRHISPAFVEDPVRVLRVARFAARYAHLGFKIADETRQLMYQMVCKKELSHLVPERVWQELYKALKERNPEVFFYVLRQCGALNEVFSEIDQLFGIPNHVELCPEVDNGINTMLSLERSVLVSDESLVRFATLVHCFGKLETPIKQWPYHPDYEKKGVNVINDFCHKLRVPKEYRQFSVMASQYGVQLAKLPELSAEEIVTLIEKMDVIRRPSSLENLILFARALKNIDSDGFSQGMVNKWHQLVKVCHNVKAKDVMKPNIKGPAVKEALHQERIKQVKKLLNKLEH